MLPAHSRATTRQGTRRWRARLTVPPILVKAANSRSVPMARWGLTPKKKISTGVIREPPPTPVRPTIRPTANPAKTNARSCMGVTVGVRLMVSNYCLLLQVYRYMYIDSRARIKAAFFYGEVHVFAMPVSASRALVHGELGACESGSSIRWSPTVVTVAARGFLLPCTAELRQI